MTPSEILEMTANKVNEINSNEVEQVKKMPEDFDRLIKIVEELVNVLPQEQRNEFEKRLPKVRKKAAENIKSRDECRVSFFIKNHSI